MTGIYSQHDSRNCKNVWISKAVVAMLSYSNFGSSDHPMANKVVSAVKFIKRSFPNIVVDGPVQSDFCFE